MQFQRPWSICFRVSVSFLRRLHLPFSASRAFFSAIYKSMHIMAKQNKSSRREHQTNGGKQKEIDIFKQRYVFIRKALRISAK